MDKSTAIAAEIPRLRRYARALTGDAGEADDLVQECLTRALAKRGQWREGGTPRKWLFAILRNLYMDELRRRKRRPREVELDQAQPSAAAGADPGPQLFEIGDALARLPGEQREALLLVTLEGLSYAETAEVLDIPVGTVMSRIARGRERLRQSIFGDDLSNRRLKRVK
jgi:RNA polymerase sigma-70 factor (ECF subfamily)